MPCQETGDGSILLNMVSEYLLVSYNGFKPMLLPQEQNTKTKNLAMSAISDYKQTIFNLSRVHNPLHTDATLCVTTTK